MPSKPSEESCGGPAAKACSIGLAIFLVGGVLGLILFLTDGGGVIVDVITGGAPSSTSVVGPSSPAQLLDPTCAEDIEERGGAGGGRTGSKCELCKAGFWGANCTACPLCGTHGTCSGSGTTSGTGACACAPGWTTSSGSSGSLQQCDACALGYFGPDCAPCAACSGHGTCADSGTHGTDGSCVCVSSNDTNTGRTTSFAGADCSTCAPGHYGSTCASCTVDCGEHGACADGMQGDGRCRCNPGFTGDACESCAPGVGWAPSSNVPCKLGPGLKDLGDGNYTACSGHCTLNTTTGRCVCDDATWTGPGCETKVCDHADKQGEQCQICDCNNRGACDGAGTVLAEADDWGEGFAETIAGWSATADQALVVEVARASGSARINFSLQAFVEQQRDGYAFTTAVTRDELRKHLARKARLISIKRSSGDRNGDGRIEVGDVVENGE